MHVSLPAGPTCFGLGYISRLCASVLLDRADVSLIQPPLTYAAEWSTAAINETAMTVSL